jgi:hypothetical protein
LSTGGGSTGSFLQDAVKDKAIRIPKTRRNFMFNNVYIKIAMKNGSAHFTQRKIVRRLRFVEEIHENAED